MIRRQFCLVSVLATAALVTRQAFGKIGDAMVGKMTSAEFDAANRKGAAEVAGVIPAPGPVSDADALLMTELAAGGIMQLELSKIAVQKATAPDVQLFARGEVDEQTGLSVKMLAVAEAKNRVLPGGPDDKTTALLERFRGMAAGPAFDTAYMEESGVKGHLLLDNVMKRVLSQAQDATLKTLVAAAHPLVRIHLEAAQAEVA